MCGKLGELRSALSAYADAFDPESFASSDAAKIAREAGKIESIAAVLKARAAARAAAAGGFSREGNRSAAEVLARETGTSVSAANEAIETGKRLSSQPEVARAAAQGELSMGQASLISGAVDADPSAADKLLEKAKNGSLSELKDACGKVIAAVEDLEQRRRRIRRHRSLRSWTDAFGFWHLHAKGNPEDGAQVMAAVGQFAQRAFEAARREGRREPSDAYAFDGLVDLARSMLSNDEPATPTPAAAICSSADDEPNDEATDLDATIAARPDSESDVNDPDGLPADTSDSPTLQPSEVGTEPARTDSHWIQPGLDGVEPGMTEPAPPGSGTAECDAPERWPRPGGDAAGAAGAVRPLDLPRRQGAQVKLLVRIDYDTFLRGVSREGETCELVGYGPIAVSAVRDLIETGDPFVAAILTRGEALVGVAHLGRKPRAVQRSALEWLYPSCAVVGCPAQARLEMDHRADWAKTHFTMLDLLDRLCRRHHKLKTEQGWGLVEGTGKRAFVPPNDSRHPRHAAAPRAGPA